MQYADRNYLNEAIMLEKLFRRQDELPAFNRHSGKTVMDQLNMGRLYAFNVIGCAVVFVAALFMKVCGLYFMDENYQTFALLLFSLVMALCAAAIFCTSRAHMHDIYDKACLVYIALFSAVMFNFAFRAHASAASLIMYWILMMVAGCLPVLRLEVFSAVWVLEIIPVVILAITKKFTADAITSVVTISIMGIVLSVASYSNTVRKLTYKLSLDSALSEAETDPMTKLLNRRGLDRRLDSIWPHCIRQKTSVAVIMMDIDNFKKYNDTFGHAAGDECIKAVTGAIHRSVKRRTDYGARVGGEEFLVFLTGIEPKLAVKWALDLKKSIEDLHIPHADTNFNPYVTVSMGMSCVTVTDNIDFEMIREDADKELYEAKYNGKACLYFRHKAFGKHTILKKVGNQ